MARFCGTVGFIGTMETRRGVYDKVVTEEREYRGDVIRNARRNEGGINVNDKMVLNNSISVLADDYIYDHLGSIAYVKWMGALWTVTNVEVQRPRLLLTIGGVYHG